MLIGLATIVALFTVLWIASLALKNASIVDIWWGPGFIVMAGAYLAVTDGFAGRRQLITALVVLWGLRLARYIGSRNIGHGEDFRYAKWRQENGASWWWYSYFKVFLLQAVVLGDQPLLAACKPWSELRKLPLHLGKACQPR